MSIIVWFVGFGKPVACGLRFVAIFEGQQKSSLSRVAYLLDPDREEGLVVAGQGLMPCDL